MLRVSCAWETQVQAARKTQRESFIWRQHIKSFCRVKEAVGVLEGVWVGPSLLVSGAVAMRRRNQAVKLFGEPIGRALPSHVRRGFVVAFWRRIAIDLISAVLSHHKKGAHHPNSSQLVT